MTAEPRAEAAQESSGLPSADLLRERAQRLELFTGHVLEAIAVNAVNSTIQPAQQLETGLGDLGGDHTSIARIANAFHQATFLVR